MVPFFVFYESLFVFYVYFIIKIEYNQEENENPRKELPLEKYPFTTPDEKYRGLDLWMVNDKLTDEEITHQVEEFKKKGLYSVIFRTYNGLVSDYPGPNFKHSVRVAVEAAKK